MYNIILWTLDNELDCKKFERLCTDLLSREGFRDIIPIGSTHDHGRDAELRIYTGVKLTGGITFFQYSLDKKWESKLLKELVKVKNYDQSINFYVFVTSQKVSGEKRDKLEDFVQETYNWNLVIFDREWLRHRLEETSPDLAVKYLGIKDESIKNKFKLDFKPEKIDGSIQGWELYEKRNYEAAIVEFKEYLKRNPYCVDTLLALVWSQYSLFRYNEALININKILTYDKDNINAKILRGCVLAEDGIQIGNKSNLLLAKEIFAEIAVDSDRWVDHYNLGNTLEALGEFESAKKQFLKAAELDSQKAEIWKNLGSVYFHLGKHEKELNCYDRALSINGNLTQAIISKGVTYLVIFNNYKKSINLLEKALHIDEKVNLEWPHIWYWLTFAYIKANNLRTALKKVNNGLAVVPHHEGLFLLKSEIYTNLTKNNIEFIDEAIEFFKFRLEVNQNDYKSFTELMLLYEKKGRSVVIWKSFDEYFDFGSIKFSTYLDKMNHSVEEYLTSFKYLDTYYRYREIIPISDYIEFLSSKSIHPDENFEDAMYLVCAIPFGLSCEILSKTIKKHIYKSIKKVHRTILNSLKFSLTKISSMIIGDFSSNDINEKIEFISKGMVDWNIVALIELSREFGYISGMFGLSNEELDSILSKENKFLKEWNLDIITNSFLELNEKLKLFNK